MVQCSNRGRDWGLRWYLPWANFALTTPMNCDGRRRSSAVPLTVLRGTGCWWVISMRARPQPAMTETPARSMSLIRSPASAYTPRRQPAMTAMSAPMIPVIPPYAAVVYSPRIQRPAPTVIPCATRELPVQTGSAVRRKIAMMGIPAHQTPVLRPPALVKTPIFPRHFVLTRIPAPMIYAILLPAPVRTPIIPRPVRMATSAQQAMCVQAGPVSPGQHRSIAATTMPAPMIPAIRLPAVYVPTIQRPARTVIRCATQALPVQTGFAERRKIAMMEISVQRIPAPRQPARV